MKALILDTLGWQAFLVLIFGWTLGAPHDPGHGKIFRRLKCCDQIAVDLDTLKKRILFTLLTAWLVFLCWGLL